MSRDKKPTAREEKAPHPPSNENKPVTNNRRPELREHLELFSSNASADHRIRSERQILWENDLYERQSI